MTPKTPRYPFICFSKNKNDAQKISPVFFHSWGDLRFIMPGFSPQPNIEIFIKLMGEKNTVICPEKQIDPSMITESGYWKNNVLSPKTKLEDYQCVQIVVRVVGDILPRVNVYYSNWLKYVRRTSSDIHYIEYWDNPQQKYCISLNCEINNPQSKTKTKEYVDSNGRNILLSKTRRKEYELQTGYFDSYLHDALKEAFMFPHLQIDGKDMFESGDYDIDWANADATGCATAKTKVSEQHIERYSYC